MDINGFSSKQVQLCYSIGEFFFKECNGDRDAAYRSMQDIDFQAIAYHSDFRGKYVEITIGRPGLLIGLKGERIEKLKDHLGMPVKIVEAHATLLQLLNRGMPYTNDEDLYDYEWIDSDEDMSEQ